MPHTVSFPCDSNALQAQLEAWTNVAFDFDSPSDDGPLSASSPSNKQQQHALHHDAFSAYPHAAANNTAAFGGAEASESAVDLNAFLGTNSATSLVDPALSLPPFVHAGHALPDAFFVAPGIGASHLEPATLSPADITAASTPAAAPVTAAAAAPSPARASRASNTAGKKAAGSAGPARKKRASSSAAAAVPAASTSAATPASATGLAKAGSSSSASVAASSNSEASTPAAKMVALPLPEGIDPKGLNDEDLNRLAIEEDKRRRNTAASARFRVKKKQREQALEMEAKELRERVAVLEKEVDTLKTENGWLRGLITDKHIE